MDKQQEPAAAPTPASSFDKRAAVLQALRRMPRQALISGREVAALYGCSESTIRHSKGSFGRMLPPRLAGLGTQRWRLGDVLDWLDELPTAGDPSVQHSD